MRNFSLMLLMSLFVIGMFYSCKDDDDDMTPMDDDDEMVVDTMDVDTMIVDTMDTDTMVVDTMPEGNPNATVWKFFEDDYTEEAVQEAMIEMDDEDTIIFGPGTFTFQSTLSVDDKNNVVIMGDGMEETILDFSNQLVGAEGLKITANNTILANFTVQNTIGDAIKAKDCEHFSFLNVATVWTGEASENNGAYGIYPVTCRHILIDGCFAYGASDAGIYVGQTEYIIVRNSRAERNVAGIEIENSKYADVYNNTATGNTGGILVFDLPGLSMYGEQCRVFDNHIEQNDYRNFAPEGNVVGDVPAGTGIMIMATKDCEIFNNDIINNNTLGVGLVDYEVLAFLSSVTWDDPLYISAARGVYVHDNNFQRTNDCPVEQNAVGTILESFFDDCMMPDIMYDGTTAQADLPEDGKLCISNNGDISWSNLYLNDWPANTVEMNPEEFNCVGTVLPEVTVEAPTL